MVTLETEADRAGEQHVIERILGRIGPDFRSIRFPAFSLLDYAIINQHTTVLMLEIKVRKESRQQIQSYGGLMLKHRKISELAALQEALKTPVFVVFAFDNGRGEILATTPSDLTDLPGEAPPRRRNFRGLAADEEPVVYLDWVKHLTPWETNPR